MGLKLTLGVDDKVVMDCGVVVDVIAISSKQVALVFNAAPDIKINAVFKDSSKMFKNRRK